MWCSWWRWWCVGRWVGGRETSIWAKLTSPLSPAPCIAIPFLVLFQLCLMRCTFHQAELKNMGIHCRRPRRYSLRTGAPLPPDLRCWRWVLAILSLWAGLGVAAGVQVCWCTWV